MKEEVVVVADLDQTVKTTLLDQTLEEDHQTQEEEDHQTQEEVALLPRWDSKTVK